VAQGELGSWRPERCMHTFNLLAASLLYTP
jgi:hypothetical protein